MTIARWRHGRVLGIQKVTFDLEIGRQGSPSGTAPPRPSSASPTTPACSTCSIATKHPTNASSSAPSMRSSNSAPRGKVGQAIGLCRLPRKMGQSTRPSRPLQTGFRRLRNPIFQANPNLKSNLIPRNARTLNLPPRNAQRSSSRESVTIYGLSTPPLRAATQRGILSDRQITGRASGLELGRPVL